MEMDQRLSFNDEARQLLKSAEEAAQERNNETLGTEHLLLGIVENKYPRSAATEILKTVLEKLNVDRNQIELLLEEKIRPGPVKVMGKLPQTDRAKRVFEAAIEEAKVHGHTYVGTEHILIGLIRDYDSTAGQVLLELKVTAHDVRDEMMRLASSSKELDEFEIHIDEKNSTANPDRVKITRYLILACVSFKQDYLLVVQRGKTAKLLFIPGDAKIISENQDFNGRILEVKNTIDFRIPIIKEVSLAERLEIEKATDVW